MRYTKVRYTFYSSICLQRFLRRIQMTNRMMLFRSKQEQKGLVQIRLWVVYNTLSEKDEANPTRKLYSSLLLIMGGLPNYSEVLIKIMVTKTAVYWTNSAWQNFVNPQTLTFSCIEYSSFPGTIIVIVAGVKSSKT